ncbi:glycosyltransferase family 2 protein [Nakamurella sp.]|uniref:glycosyltransferase family 2 protein n=1 Tax=Nakamurella sp. TaxID=1869182 RepID=UPI003784911B
MTTAVVTIVRGRHEHLHAQQRGLRLGHRRPDLYVVVGMGDPDATAATRTGPLAGSGCTLLLRDIPGDGALPLAAARNAGAAAALAAGADILVFLDVDCVPGLSLVQTYTTAVLNEARPALHCGVVQYLAEGIDAARIDPGALHGRPHPARPRPDRGRSIPSADWQLFWSLSFAVSAHTWRRLGGFCEEYRGYGGEDTDLGYHAFRLGIDLRWWGDADAFHQYHDSPSPPTPHLVDIVRNATIFHRRWRFWPMQGWLTAFADLGLARYDPDRDAWTVVDAAAADEASTAAP